MKLADLKLNPDNPRNIKDEKLEKLAQSIKDFPKMMVKRPIVYDENKVIIGGNMRYRAIQSLGMTEIPDEWVSDASDFTPDERYRFIMQDNAEMGEHDWDAVANQYELEDLEAWGIDVPYADSETEVEEDEAPEVSQEEPKSKLGEIYQLGRHRVMCGDSTDKASVDMLMNGEKADMVFTDPPYSSGGFQESGKKTGSIGARGEKKILTDTLSTRGYNRLMDDVLALCNKAGAVFVFCDWKMWIVNFDIVERAGYIVRNMLVWDKKRMGMGMPFRNQHELVVFGSKIAGKIGNGNTPNVLSYDRELKDGHPNQKPVQLICDCLQQMEDLKNIYDPFLGSGSTLIACEQTDRTCYGCELDPKYVDVIRRRYWKFVNGGDETGWEEGTPAL